MSKRENEGKKGEYKDFEKVKNNIRQWHKAKMQKQSEEEEITEEYSKRTSTIAHSKSSSRLTQLP